MFLKLAVSAAVFSLVICLFLVKLSSRLQRTHGKANPQATLSADELDQVQYNDIDMLKAIPSQPTLQNYAVIGGSGFLGTYIIRLLLLRGETNIRILDVNPPEASDISTHPSISFIKTDITSLKSVRDGLTQPFSKKSGPAHVIYHTAAVIRFYERADYTWPLSHGVNVQGTGNVISAAKKLPNAMLIYTSTADVALPRPKFFRLGRDYTTSPWDKVIVSDSDAPLNPDQHSESCYTRSKVLAERLVLGANGWNNLKTGVIRPGYTLIGPHDRLICSTLTMPRLPVFDEVWSQTQVCVWDVAAAHLLYEEALHNRPEESAGQAFLVSGNGPAWTLRDIRAAVKHYAAHPILLEPISPLIILILAHAVELFLYLRYHALLPYYTLRRSKPSLAPRWIGQLQLIQPATLEYMCDIVIDDSRARKVLGYQPQWSTVQCIKYTVDTMESAGARQSHGLELWKTK